MEHASITRSATEVCMAALRRYPVVGEETAPDDPSWNEKNYLMLGRAGLDAIRLALLCAQKDRPTSILDFGSGYGRMTRFLRAEYPEARLAVCDIDHRAVDFCAERFGAEPIYGGEHPPELAEPFELVWVCSVLTHLDLPAWEEMFSFFKRAVTPGGVLAFTVQGRAIRERMLDPAYGDYYLCSVEHNRELAESLDGFTFMPYYRPPIEHEPSRYGISLVEPWWLFRFLDRLGWKITTYVEDRWGGQDVVGMVRWEPGIRPFRQPLRHPVHDR